MLQKLAISLFLALSFSTQFAFAQRALVLEPAKIVDESNGLTASTLIIPKGWQVQPQILWRTDHAQFACNTSTVIDPRGGAAVRWLPIDHYHANAGLFRHRVGNVQIADGMEFLERPLSVLEFIQHLAIARYRNAPGLRIIAAEELPKIAEEVARANSKQIQLLRAGGQTIRYSAGRMRIEYRDSAGSDMHEDVYCVLASTENTMLNETARQAGLLESQTTLLYPERLYSFAAPKGQLDAATPILQTIASSNCVMPEWAEQIMGVQKARMQGFWDREGMLEEHNSAVASDRQHAYESHVRSSDRVAQAFGDTITSTRRFIDTKDNGREVLLPQSYKHAFRDGQGSYIMTNDPNYSPTSDPNLKGEWNAMAEKT